jgi:FkbM family methyltransferase
MYQRAMFQRSLRSVAQRGVSALEAIAQGHSPRTLLRLHAAGVFKLPIVFGHLRPGMTPMILDVGAARGESGHSALSAFPDATIHSFEPIASEFAELKRATTAHPHWHAHPVAAGSTCGSRDIVVCDHIKQASSFLRIADATRNAWPMHDFSSQHTQTVEVTTLDNFASTNGITQVDILKLDVQGMELDALAGATKLLEHTSYVITEVAFQPMYVGGCQFGDVMDFLQQRGLFLRALSREVRDPRGRIVQADALFGAV